MWESLLTEANIATEKIPVVFAENIGPLLVRLPFRYLLVLPEEPWELLSETAKRGILRHELEHYRRGDILKSFGVWLLSLVHWFNPCAWLARIRFDDAAEWACDDAAHGHTDTGIASYTGALIVIHENRRLQQAAHRAILGRAIRGKRFSERIDRLIHFKEQEDSMFKKTCLITLLALCLVPAFVRVRLVAAPNPTPVAMTVSVVTEPAVEPETQTPLENVTVYILDEDGKPLPDAVLDINRTKYNADADGKVVIPFGNHFESFSTLYLEARAAKHALWVISLKREEGVWDEVKPEYVFKLKRGRTISGKIINENNEPVQGARLGVGYSSLSRRNWGEYAGIYQSDENGMFTCETIPPGIENIQIDITHPDYMKIQGYTSQSGFPDLQAFLDGTAVVTLQQGYTLRGTITDPDGKPVEEALIFIETVRAGQNLKAVKTDADGKYEVPNWNPVNTIVAVMIEGFAPDTRRIDFGQTQEPVDFQLKPGNTVRFRVTDPQGNPVTGTHVSPFRWRGESGPLTGSWQIAPGSTDENGCYEWNWAPEDEIQYTISKPGWTAIRDYPMSPRDEEYEITMYPPLTISGKVVNAETKEPVTSFTVITGIIFENSTDVYWEIRNTTQWNDGTGTFKCTFDEARGGHQLRVTADGYAPVESRKFTNEEGNVTFDVELQPQAMLEVAVVLADDQPAVGTLVYLIDNKTTHFPLTDLKPTSQTNTVVLKPDASGKLSLPGKPEDYVVFAIHDDGVAIATSGQLVESPTIRLAPWARIEGKLAFPITPGDHKAVILHPQFERQFGNDFRQHLPQLYMNVENRAKPDADGRFVIEKAFPNCPSRLTYSNYLEVPPYFAPYHIKEIEVTLKPGETTEVTLGGQGSVATGTIVLPDDQNDAPEWKYSMMTFTPHIDFPPRPKIPEEIRLKFGGTLDSDEMPYSEEYEKWMKEWRETNDEGKAYSEALQVAVEKRNQSNGRVSDTVFLPANDGSFRFDDLEPGEYDVTVRLGKPGNPHVMTLNATKPVTVPAKSGSVIDLGRIEAFASK